MYALALALAVFGYSLVIPVIKYFLDPKGLRKYPNFYLFVRHIRYTVYLRSPQKLPFTKSLRSPQKASRFTSRSELAILLRSQRHQGYLRSQYKLHQGSFLLRDWRLALPPCRCRATKEHARKRKVLSSAYAVKNLEEWEFKVADVSAKLIKAFDKRCTNPLPPNQNPSEEDLTVDYRNWTVLWTAAAIANIGLSEDLGFLDEGSDTVKSESKDGTVKSVSFRECHTATQRVSYQLVWSYDWFKTLRRLSKVFSSSYRRMWRLDGDWGGIVYNRATTRLKRHMNGEKLDDFFTVLMGDKNGTPHNLEWGEIVAEINIMMNAGHDPQPLRFETLSFSC